MNKLKQHKNKVTFTSFLCLVFLLTTSSLFAQAPTIENGKTYKLENVTVIGSKAYSEATVIAASGLRKGKEIILPTSKEISAAIKKLWETKLFSSVDVYVTKIDGNAIDIEIELTDLPQLNQLTIDGVNERKSKKIIEENKLQKGVKVTENLVTTTKNYLEKKYRKKGFLKANVNIISKPIQDSTNKPKVNMLLDINKGSKIKIKNIAFTGNEKISSKKLRKFLKKTKKRQPFRFYKRSKYIEDVYNEDLINLVDKYKERGYRDARVVSDTLIYNDDNTITLNLDVIEGEKYTYGDVKFLGNVVFSDEQLNQILKISRGDTYNGVELQKRIADNSRPDALDLTNFYQNNGYLFSRIIPVETKADGNVIDMEIRIVEGKPAYINNVNIIGNDVTNDKVIYRELRIRPGQLYSKSNIIRTIREIGALGYFDAQQVSPDLTNVNQVDGALDIDLSVVEQGSSQIELQGGFGGGGFIGTLGLSFNNFSIKDIFNKSAYKPVPRGDGQSVALRLQASQFFQTYSLNFSEPWLGGKKPVRFSASISRSTQFQFDQLNGGVDRDSRFNITGATFGLTKRLTVPDDFFVLSQSLTFQNYDLQNFSLGSLFSFRNGSSNNISYTAALSRRSTRVDPIYPTGGSEFSLTGEFSLPYSTFNGVDYGELQVERGDAVDRLNGNETLSNNTRTTLTERIQDIDRERLKFLEFYKIQFKALLYSQITDKLVLRPSIDFGFLGAYNNDRGVIPFERFFLGGSGLQNGSLDGRQIVGLRGYPDNSLTTSVGSSIYNKYSLELRYPVILEGQTKIYLLGFAEAGQAFDSFKEFDPFNVNRSAGAGVRIFLPSFGLLGIDFGYGFDPLPGLDTPNGLETHFIIGQQF